VSTTAQSGVNWIVDWGFSGAYDNNIRVVCHNETL
jgi:hypothetical protein